MHRFQGIAVTDIQINPAPAKGIGLLIEFIEGGSSFVINKGLGDEDGPVTGFIQPYAQVNILGYLESAETSHLLKASRKHPHVETPRLIFPHMLFPAPYPPCGKRRGHGIADGFLNRGKRLMGGIGTAENLGRIFSSENWSMVSRYAGGAMQSESRKMT